MDKRYEKNPEQSKYMKEKLLQKYPEIFEKYEIDESTQIQVCNMVEFLIVEHPEKYDRTAGTRMDYENNEELRRIYAVVNKEKNVAVMINTNENGKMPEGEYGVYDLQNHKFELTNEEVKNRIKLAIKSINKDGLSKDVDVHDFEKEMFEKLCPKNLDEMEKLATIDNRIEVEAKRLVTEKTREVNRKNGKTEEEIKAIEAENGKQDKNEEKVVIGQGNDSQDKAQIPKDVEEACKRLGIMHVKSYFYVNARELSEKVDGTRVNKNGNRVLIIEVADSTNVSGPNKYYGMQDNRMILYGNENKEIRDVTGNVTKMGKLVKPLKLQSPEYIEYKDSEGLVIREQIDDRANLSVQEIENYKNGMEDILERYSQNIYMIKYDSNLSPEEKIEQIQKIDDWCDEETTDIALENDISMNDDKNIDAMTDEHTEDIQEEIEAWEVPGKRER